MPCNSYRLALLVAAVVCQCSLCAAEDGYLTVVDNGPSSNRIDMVFLGDGYTASQIDTVYAGHIQTTLDNFFGGNEDPFPRYRNFFNAYRVDVISNESGADRPPEGIWRDTALDAQYYYEGGPREHLYFNRYKADAVLAGSGLLEPEFSIEMQMVTVNDTIYGGGGTNTYSVFAGGSGFSWQIALHELGHSFAGLADEYVTGTQTYVSSEPNVPNATISPTGEKWSQWLGYCDPDHPEMGPIGAYEGALIYYSSGVYRPSATSKMRSVDRPFDAVSREEIILDIYDHVDPLDGALDNGTTLVDPASLWVDTIDPSVIKVQWFVDDELVTYASSEVFYPFNLSPGEHQIKARAYDDTPWVRKDLDQLEQLVTWTVNVTTPLEPIPGDANLDGTVDASDLGILASHYGAGSGAEWGDGDFDNDSMVDVSDLGILASNYGTSMQTAAVPEAGTAVLMALGMMAMLIRRRRR